MSLEPGTRIGPYEVVAPLGAGGMGEVYRARDTKLDREVALKVLPEGFIADADRLARFEREAKVLASLNHPNIGHIYGLEEASEQYALVLELVEGPTLADRIAQGPISLDEAVPIAKQIAEALEAAHEQGIIHRDLKPANVKVKTDGTVKVLDFGLAKTYEGDRASGASADLSQSPTLANTGTQAGVILGTAAYMSPEQARGKPVDKRADIWAFGCVLFEMLAGRRAFVGEDVSLTLAEIMKGVPEWSALPRETPEPVTRLIRRCTEKEPRRRLRDIGEARILLEETDTWQGSDQGPGEAAPARFDRRLLLAWGGAALASLVAVVTLWRAQPPLARAPPAVTRLAVRLPADQQLNVTLDHPIALSPDGRRLVYTVQDEQGTRLYARGLDQFEAVKIPGTEGGKYPFFSPDGEWVGFFASGLLKKIALAGGDPQPICDAPPAPLGATWGAGGTIVFGSKEPGGLWKVPASGGTAERLTTVDVGEGETTHSSPYLLPNGEMVLFTVVANGENTIGAVSLTDGGRRMLDELGAAEGPRYAASGHLVFARGSALWAVAFDPDRVEVTGAPFFVSGNLETQDQLGERRAVFALSPSGSLAYVPVRPADVLGWVDRGGHFDALLEDTSLGLPRLSPDGSRVAITVDKGEGLDVWLLDPERGTFSPFAVEGTNIEPIWTPDGERVTFTSNRSGGRMGLFEKAVDGRGEPAPLYQPEGGNTPFAGSWSPDGEVLAFYERSTAGVRDIWLLPRGGEPLAIVNTPANEHSPMFSPDSRWLAYVSDTTGQEEVYVRDREGSGPPWQVSHGGGSEPTWSQAGRELFYRSGDRMMAVAVTTEPTFSPSRPELLFEGVYERNPNLGGINYDVAADGNRFLFVRQTPLEIRLVVNWVVELTRLASEK